MAEQSSVIENWTDNAGIYGNIIAKELRSFKKDAWTSLILEQAPKRSCLRDRAGLFRNDPDLCRLSGHSGGLYGGDDRAGQAECRRVSGVSGLSGTGRPCHVVPG